MDKSVADAYTVVSGARNPSISGREKRKDN